MLGHDPMKLLDTSFTRFRFASRFGLAHMAASALVAALVAALIFWLWFPYPYRELTGGRELFWLIISVDVVCGPLLTWVIAAPHKSRRELAADIGMVAVLQVAALAYGLFILSQARPVALVFEQDRFRAVTVADIDSGDLEKAEPAFQSLSYTGPKLVGVREPISADESFEAISQGLSGIEPSMRPNWWGPYSQAVPSVQRIAKPVAALRNKHPSSARLIDDAVRQSGIPESELVWLPLVSRNSYEWVVMLDKGSAQPRAFVALDGFL
jgi:hypothetical protein